MWRRARRRSSAPISYGHKAVTEDVRSSHPPLLLAVTVPPSLPPVHTPRAGHGLFHPRFAVVVGHHGRARQEVHGSIWTTEARHTLFFAGLSPRSPPPARHTPPKPAAPSPSLPGSAASLGRPAWQAAVRGVLMGQKRRPEVHVQVGAQRGTAARDGGARLGVHRGARPGRGGGGVYGRRG